MNEWKYDSLAAPVLPIPDSYVTRGHDLRDLRGVYSDTTQVNWTELNSTELNWPVEQRTAKSVVFWFMTSRPTNWVNCVTTFIDRWQLFTLWTCRQLDVELSYVAINGPFRVVHGHWKLCRTRDTDIANLSVWHCVSVRPSVCLSVTFRYQMKTA